jgi:hypothetical protein
MDPWISAITATVRLVLKDCVVTGNATHVESIIMTKWQRNYSPYYTYDLQTYTIGKL